MCVGGGGLRGVLKIPKIENLHQNLKPETPVLEAKRFKPQPPGLLHEEVLYEMNRSRSTTEGGQHKTKTKLQLKVLLLILFLDLKN